LHIKSKINGWSPAGGALLDQLAGLTVLMLKSATRSAGMATREK
jgi:hypothetical protein